MAVYSWGLGKSGQLGLATLENSYIPTRIKLDYLVTDISCGNLFSAVVTSTGEVYSFGEGKFGRLGNGDEISCSLPIPIKKLNKAEKVACGSWHACALDKSGRVYSWGYSTHGVHGITIHDQGLYVEPTIISGLTTQEIVGVTCGHNFTLAWSRDGKAFSWGSGRNGVLGHGNDQDCHEPKQIMRLSDEHVVFMDAGYAHCAAVTEHKVYMFGKGKDLALGLGANHRHTTPTPTVVPEMSCMGIKAVSCSKGEHHGHTLALTADGSVYSWGDGYKGKLGHGSSSSLCSPKLIPQSSFLNDKIVSVSCGGIHSAAVSDLGHLFTWGCGSDGRLGHPEAKGHRYLFKSDIPKLVEKLNRKTVQISCSYYHCLALVKD